MLPRHTRCVLSRLRCNGHSLLLGSYLSRIGRIENPSCSACGHSSQDTSHLILHCPATDSAPLTLWRLSVSVRPLVQTLGSCSASGAPWSSAMPPSLGRGRVNNNDNSFGSFVSGTPFVHHQRSNSALGNARVRTKHIRSSSDISVPTSTDDQTRSSSSTNDAVVSSRSLNNLDEQERKSSFVQAPKPPHQSAKPGKRVALMPPKEPLTPPKERITYLSSV